MECFSDRVSRESVGDEAWRVYLNDRRDSGTTLVDAPGNSYQAYHHGIKVLHADFDLRVLFFDGGGMRGLTALYTLDKLLKRYHNDDEDHGIEGVFDHVVGTSTGGLAAIMLGRLNMTVGECIKHYLKLGPIIFKNDGGITRWVVYGEERYTNTVDEMEAYIKEYLHGDEPLRTDVQHVPTAVTTMEHDGSECLFLRSYQSKHSQQDVIIDKPVKEITILEAARATAAAFSYLPPINIGGHLFIDAGIGGFNNPTLFAMKEVQVAHSRDGYEMAKIGCIVSLGTGQDEPFPDFADIVRERKTTNTDEAEDVQSRLSFKKSLWEGLFRFKSLVDTPTRLGGRMKYLGSIASNSKRVHDNVLHMFEKDKNIKNVYFRFDPPQLGTMDLASLNIFDIQRRTAQYLSNDGDRMVACVARLQVIQRARDEANKAGL